MFYIDVMLTYLKLFNAQINTEKLKNLWAAVGRNIKLRLIKGNGLDIIT